MKDVITENYQLMFGDCLERMKEIPDGSVDLILTDPPFGVVACKWDSVIPFEPMWEQLKRIIKPNGAIVLFGAEPFSSKLRCSNLKMFKYDWIWAKNRATGVLNAKKQPLRTYENISVFYSKQPMYNPQGLIPYNKNSRNSKRDSEVYGKGQTNLYIQEWSNYPKNILEFDSVQRTQHPTQKPVALLEYLIKTYTNEGETVLDFTAGSFSTGVASLNTNRKFIGVEMDGGYFNIGVKRMSDVTR